MIIALFALPALAGGYYYADSGIIANGRGCAYVAGADSQFAQYYNPAGLVRIVRPTFNFGASGTKQAISFARYDASTDTLAPPEKNEGGFFAVPELGFATPIGKNFGFAVGFTSGLSPAYQFPADGAQRYTIIDTTIWNFQIGPTLAWRPDPHFAIGIGPQWQILRLEDQLKVTISGRDDPSGDVSVDANVWDKFTPSVNVGVLVEPIPQLSIGAMVQPGSNYNGKGKGTLDFTGSALENLLDQKVYTDDAISLAIQLPWFIRTGVAVRPVPNLEIEGDFFYETWSALGDIVVSDINVTVTGANGAFNQPVQDTIALPAGFRDAWSARAGVEGRANPWLELRTGGFYESSSLTPQQVSVALVDTPKWMVGGGSSFHLFGDQVVLDDYMSVVLYKSLSIRDSTVHQINVMGGDEAIVGNGDITSTGLSLGAAIRIQPGKDERPRDPWSVAGGAAAAKL